MGDNQAVRVPDIFTQSPLFPVLLPMHPYLAVSDRAQRQLRGFSLFAAPLLTGVSTFLWHGRDVGISSGAIQVVAAAFWIVALLGMAELLRLRWQRTAAVMSLVVVYAGIGGSSFAFEGMFGEAFAAAGSGEISRLELRRALGWSILPAMLVPGGFFPLSLIAFGVLLWRLKAVPAWCMLVLVVGGISFPLGRIPRIQTIAHLSDLLLLIGLAPVGWRYLQAREA